MKLVTVQPIDVHFTLDWSFEMRYCIRFYLNQHRNYAWSKLELQYLLNKNQTSKFDHAQFLCQLRLKFIQFFILKLQSMVKLYAKGQRMLAFLRNKTALLSWAVKYIKLALVKQQFSALQSPTLICSENEQNSSLKY